MAQQQQKTVQLIGGAPWGFRIGGGVEFGCPLEIVKIRKKGKADLAGLQEGDILVNIDGQNVSSRTHADAAKLLEASGNTVMLGIMKRPSVPSMSSDSGITLQSEIEVADDSGVVESSMTFTSSPSQSQPAASSQLKHAARRTSQPEAPSQSQTAASTTPYPLYRFYAPPPEHGLISCENEEVKQVTKPISVSVWRHKKQAVIAAAEEKVAQKQPKDKPALSPRPIFNAAQFVSRRAFSEEPPKAKSQSKEPVVVAIKPFKKERTPAKTFKVSKHAVELNRWMPKEIPPSRSDLMQSQKVAPVHAYEDYTDDPQYAYREPGQFPAGPKIAMQIPSETHQLEGEVDGSCCGAGICKHSIYSIHNKKPPNHVPGMISSLMYDNTQGCYGTNLLVRPYKKIYADSSFYDTPDADYPTIQDQVTLCKQIAHNMEAPANLKSRGGLMFLKRKIRSEKYAKVSVGTGSAEQQDHGSLDGGLPVKMSSDDHRIRMFPDPIKAHLNAEELENVHNNSDVLCKHDLLPPTLAFKLSKDLKRPYSKAASVFAQLRERADYYTVDEHNVKKVQKPNAMQEQYGNLTQNFQYLSPWAASANGNLELAFAFFDKYAAESCTDPVASLDENDLHHVLPISKEGATFGIKYKDHFSVTAPQKPEPQLYVKPKGSDRFYPVGINKLDQMLSNRPVNEATYDTYSNKWIYPRPKSDEFPGLRRPKDCLPHKIYTPSPTAREDHWPTPEPEHRQPTRLMRPKAYIQYHGGSTAVENHHMHTLGPYGISQHFLTYGVPQFRRPKEFLKMQAQHTSDFTENDFEVNELITAY